MYGVSKTDGLIALATLFFGHAFCFWLMEVVRRDMRSRWTGLSDPEYGSVPVTR
jgi:uncharacterized membrane protein YagU involved in acid resistance